MVKALRSCLEAAKGKIKAGHLILRKSPQETGRDSTMMEFIGSLWEFTCTPGISGKMK
jgi:hypothetical protein